MRSMRSDKGLFPFSKAFVLAALPVTAFLVTLPMLAIRPSPGLLSMTFAVWLILIWVSRAIKDWRGFPYLAAMLITLVLGHLGLLLGIAQDLGAAGLLVLGSWCSARTGFGLGEVWAMLHLAPLGHAGMFIGCSVGMWLAGCSYLGEWRYRMSRWLFLLLCNIGMALGMVVMQLWQLPFLGTAPPVAALLMIAQMLSGMAVGMVGAWWLANRSQSFGAPRLVAVGEGRE